MKGYLFDENLPVRLQFSPGLPLVSSSKAGKNSTDSQIWEYAKKNDLVIVSKDTDFSDRIITRNPPPWVVHLRFAISGKRHFMPCWLVSGRRSKHS